MITKQCPFCGAPLPEEAAFCPRCAKSINRRSKNKPPRPFPAKLLQRFLLCCLAAALALGRELGPGKTVVTILPDTAERYFSTPLFEE